MIFIFRHWVDVYSSCSIKNYPGLTICKLKKIEQSWNHVFWRSFWISRQTWSLQKKKIKVCVPQGGRYLNIWRFIFLNISFTSRDIREQHPNRQTDRQRYIHTYRQTDGAKILYRWLCRPVASRCLLHQIWRTLEVR